MLLENLFLLICGLVIGLLAALFATLPHLLFGSASVPWLEFGLMFLVICAAGLTTSWLASRRVMTLPLLASLRT